LMKRAREETVRIKSPAIKGINIGNSSMFILLC
jgi:hypothetical protein